MTNLNFKESLVDKSLELMKSQHFDCLAVGVVDFKSNSYDCFEISDYQKVSQNNFLYFDLASLTKFLTLSSTYFIHPELFDDELVLLLNHQAGLPAYGRLSAKDWRQQILSYKIKKSKTLYSDFSALRLMLELEKRSGKSLEELVMPFWDQELLYWQDLSLDSVSPTTGFRLKGPIKGMVHDDNAFVLKEKKCSHAGLFATIDGVCKSLLNLQKLFSFLDTVDKAGKKLHDKEQPFLCGCDRVTDVQNTLAGPGASDKTFGHLGFTGTSIWLDSEKMRGSVILTNATRSYCHDRKGLNDLRKKIGSAIWKL